MRNLEQELKLALTEREYNILASKTDVQPQLQVNYYFSSLYLGRDVMVRVREKDGRYTLCYKRRLQNTDGVMVSDEHECELTETFAKTLLRRGIYPKEINDMLGTDLYEALVCVGELVTHRTKFQLAEWTLELDKNSYLGVTDYELECECDQIQDLMKLKNFLSYNYGVVIRYALPKSQRFFEAKAKARV